MIYPMIPIEAWQSVIGESGVIIPDASTFTSQHILLFDHALGLPKGTGTGQEAFFNLDPHKNKIRVIDTPLCGLLLKGFMAPNSGLFTADVTISYYPATVNNDGTAFSSSVISGLETWSRTLECTGLASVVFLFLVSPVEALCGGKLVLGPVSEDLVLHQLDMRRLRPFVR